MRRRTEKVGASRAGGQGGDSGDLTASGVDGGNAETPDERAPVSDPAADPVVVDEQPGWDESWGRSEEERVARWLRSKVGLDGFSSTGPVPTMPVPQPVVGRRSQVGLEDHRRGLVTALEAEQQRVARADAQIVEARARLEAEIDSLEKRRRGLAAVVETREAEAEHHVRRQNVARDALVAEIAELEARESSLVAELAAAEAHAEKVRSELAETSARLERGIADRHEELVRLGAVLEAERAQAEASHQAQRLVAVRLDEEISALHETRVRLAAALDAETTRTDAEQRARMRERARLEGEIAELEAECRQPPEPVAAQAHGPAPLADDFADRPLDPSGRLAEAVAELGRHMAAVLQAERAEAQRSARARQEAEAAIEAERRAMAAQRAGQAAPGGRPTSGNRRSWRRR